MARIIEWDGENLPDELRDLPPGHYFVEPVDDFADEDMPLSPEEEEGIRLGLRQVAAGETVTHEEVLRDLGLLPPG